MKGQRSNIELRYFLRNIKNLLIQVSTENVKAFQMIAKAILLWIVEPVRLKYIDTFTEMHINIHFILAKTIVRCDRVEIFPVF